MNKRSISLTISILFNVIFICTALIIISRKGGIDYLRDKLHPEKKTDPMEFYYQVKNSEFQLSKGHNKEILFIGDSLTDNCDWYELFNDKDIKNRGIQGDVINGVLNRLHGIHTSKPRKVFLMIGINDILKGRTIGEMLTGYEKIITAIANESPTTVLYIQSILPTYNYQHLRNSDIIAINKALQMLALKHNVTYINLYDLFRNRENKLDMVYSFDGLHLNGQGYQIWKSAIETYVKN